MTEKEVDTPPRSVSAYLASIGAKGGESGTGKCKRRSKAHYARIVELAAQKRTQERLEREKEAAKQPKKKRGRPPKATTETTDKPKGKRGRPRKDQAK